MAEVSVASRLQESGAHALELDNVARHFGALVALTGISMRIAASERRAVIGSNGAGKTTLFNAITGDFLPTSGRIRFFNEDITTLPVHERIRRGLRRTYQISQLFGGLSVRDSVYLACRGASRGRFSLSRPRPDDRTMMQAESIIHAVHLVTASSGSSRSRSRSPGRRASFCSTSRRPACRRRNAAISSPSSTRCRSISASSSSSTISTWRCALPNTSR